jgi:hypothetical protein
LTTAKGLVDIIAACTQLLRLKDVFKEKRVIEQLLGVTTAIILDFKNREVYDAFSL